MSAMIARKMRRELGRLLEHRATVYRRAASGGAYTDTLQTGLRCLLQQVTAANPGSTSSDRAVFNDLRTLYFDPDYAMPEGTQIEVDVESGTRWNVVAGTITPDIGPGNVVVMRHCDVRRARG